MDNSAKILVTGGTGFLGSNILKELVKAGFSPLALRRSSSPFPEHIEEDTLSNIQWITGDILDVISLEEAMQGVDTVIHAAAVVSFNKKDKKLLEKVNLEGTANVVNLALETGVRRIVHISSIAALGRKKDSNIVDETAKWESSKNNTAYGQSKYLGELEVWRGFAEGLEGVILNPATILGYGNWNEGSNAIFKNVYKEFGWHTNGVNAFTDVEDVAKAVVMVMQSPITEQRFIISNDNWSFKKLLYTIADGFNKKRPTKNATPFLSGLAWRVEWFKSLFSGRKPLITKESAKVANSETYYDNSKLLKAFPDFRYKPLEITIKKACEKYLAK